MYALTNLSMTSTKVNVDCVTRRPSEFCIYVTGIEHTRLSNDRRSFRDRELPLRKPVRSIDVDVGDDNHVAPGLKYISSHFLSGL